MRWEQALALGLVGLILVLIYLVRVRIERWGHRRWIEHFREHQAFRVESTQFLNGRSESRKTYPQDEGKRK